MPASLWSRIRERLLGPLDRATRLADDCRHTVPGWPIGLTLTRDPAAIERCVVAVQSRSQAALPELWSDLATATPATPRGWQVIEGGRHPGSANRDMHIR